MVPKGWEVKSFAKLLKSGDVEKIQDGNHGDSHPKSSDFVKSGIPFVMARDLKKGTVDLENCAYITKEQADSLRIGFAKTGDILLSHKGTVGLVAIVPLCDEYMMLTPQVTYYRIPQDSSLMSSYLYQFLLSHEYQSRFKNLAFQSTRSYLGITAQKELSINLPPLPEQQKIAKILSTWDKAISTTERLIENSTQQKKALMQQLLTGKKRLLDDEGKRFEGEWKSAKLSNFVVFKNGKGHENFVEDDGEYIVVNSKYISSDGRVVKKTNQGLNIAEKDDVLMVMSDVPNGKAIAKCFLVTETDIYTVNQRVALFRAKKIDPTFLYYILNRNSYYLRFDDGITQTNLRKEEVLACPVPNICNQEQQKTATVLTNADKEIELLEQQLADLKQEKKSLMQVLLTGKKRVVVDGKD